jgi:hypothetical protein
MAFSYKLGCLPENVLQTLLNDRLVAKGSVMGFVTTFFQVTLAPGAHCAQHQHGVPAASCSMPRSTEAAAAQSAAAVQCLAGI